MPYSSSVAQADVTSANIVGYMGSTLNPVKYNMIAIPFNTVDGKGIDLRGMIIARPGHKFVIFDVFDAIFPGK